MRFVYVLEDDEKFQKEIAEAISFLDPKIQIRVFPKLENFASWMKLMMQTGPQSISRGGLLPEWMKQEQLANEDHQLVAVISKEEYLGVSQLPLLRQTQDLFIKRKLCPADAPTAFVLTTFDNPEFKIKPLEDRILTNIIFKPFDRLILIQHLIFAIEGRRRPSKYAITMQKSTATIEMLKEVQMEAISEVGFITRSNRVLDKVRVSKYYGAPFVVEKDTSVMALLISCKPHPKVEGEFQCVFSFLGIPSTQISHFRKRLKGKLQNQLKFDWESLQTNPDRNRRDMNFVIMEDEPAIAQGLAEMLKRRFLNLQQFTYGSFIDFLSDVDPKLAQGEEAEAPPPKAFPTGGDLEFVFDEKGDKIVTFDPPPAQPPSFFGATDVEMKRSGWWATALGSEQKETWKKWVVKPDQTQVFCVRHQKHSFYIKAASTNVDKGHLRVKFVELSPQEKSDWLSKSSRLPTAVDGIFVSHRYFGENAEEKWGKIKEAMKLRCSFEPRIFILAEKKILDTEIRALGQYIDDIFYKPLDRGHICQKMKLFFSELSTQGESLEYPTQTLNENLRTASPVTISEISEAGLVMQYYRQMSLGSFREFVLWQPYEVGHGELTATCNLVEESSQKGIYDHHFIFFGIRDALLKAIRIWIRDSYVSSKEQGGG